jgi:Ala-tRNA(Pro) deacylase
MSDTYHRLMALLDQSGVDYRLIDHPPEGRTEAASALRGHPLPAAAKCVILKVKLERYVLGVVPGDRRIDTDAVKTRYGATDVQLAAPPVAERLSGCAVGSVVPFSFAPEVLELVVDPAVLGQHELYFNAARLDRSLAMRTRDYLDVAKPRVDRIAT